MRVIGYGICGPGEAKRYMRETLEEFKRLCDEVVILCNNCDQEEIDLIKEFGFTFRQDRREWGAHQWRIKQDFIERDIKQIARDGDMLVCLDMDEVLSPDLTKEWLLAAPFDAYHVFIVDLWNDPEHFKIESCFWNVRIWRWGGGDTKFKAKPVHCGLAPEWTYHYHRHAPFLLKHKGLMLKEDRERKQKRYEKYDPDAAHLGREYYDMLKDDDARPFDETAMQKQVADEVATYKQTKPRKETMATQKKPRFAYVQNPHGETVDIPEKHVAQTMKRPGFVWIGWADEVDGEIEEMFDDTDIEETEEMQGEQQADAVAGYHNQAGEEISGDEEVPGPNPEDDEEENPMPDPNAPKEEEKVETPAAPKKTAAKKAAKKTAKKAAAKKAKK